MANARPDTTVIHMGASKFTAHVAGISRTNDLRRASYKVLSNYAKVICRKHGITNIPTVVSDQAAQLAGGM